MEASDAFRCTVPHTEPLFCTHNEMSCDVPLVSMSATEEASDAVPSPPSAPPASSPPPVFLKSKTHLLVGDDNSEVVQVYMPTPVKLPLPGAWLCPCIVPPRLYFESRRPRRREARVDVHAKPE
jgi:hypothetical protein